MTTNLPADDAAAFVAIVIFKDDNEKIKCHSKFIKNAPADPTAVDSKALYQVMYHKKLRIDEDGEYIEGDVGEHDNLPLGNDSEYYRARIVRAAATHEELRKLMKEGRRIRTPKEYDSPPRVEDKEKDAKKRKLADTKKGAFQELKIQKKKKIDSINSTSQQVLSKKFEDEENQNQGRSCVPCKLMTDENKSLRRDLSDLQEKRNLEQALARSLQDQKGLMQDQIVLLQENLKSKGVIIDKQENKIKELEDKIKFLEKGGSSLTQSAMIVEAINFPALATSRKQPEISDSVLGMKFTNDEIQGAESVLIEIEHVTAQSSVQETTSLMDRESSAEFEDDGTENLVPPELTLKDDNQTEMKREEGPSEIVAEVCPIEECVPKLLSKDTTGEKLHLGYNKWITCAAWMELEKIADVPKFVQKLTVEACGIENVHRYTASGKQGPCGPKRGDPDYKEKFPTEIINIVKHFMKLHLLSIYGEAKLYDPSHTNKEFATHCSRTSWKLDEVLNCEKGEPKRKNCLGNFGKWMTRASTENSPKRKAALKKKN